MTLREPNGTAVERNCDDHKWLRRATHVIEMRCVTISVCDDCFANLAIALSLAVTEEHPDA